VSVCAVRKEKEMDKARLAAELRELADQLEVAETDGDLGWVLRDLMAAREKITDLMNGE
jgi:hypothetical protein